MAAAKTTIEALIDLIFFCRTIIEQTSGLMFQPARFLPEAPHTQTVIRPLGPRSTLEK
jgi:hypothetical protein